MNWAGKLFSNSWVQGLPRPTNVVPVWALHGLKNRTLIRASGSGFRLDQRGIGASGSGLRSLGCVFSFVFGGPFPSADPAGML